MKILAIGQSVRNIACSASRAGHLVIAADYYRDLDLEDCAFKALAIPPLPESRGHIQACVDEHSPDAVVLGPGLEEVEVKGTWVLNNSPDKFSLVSDKLWLSLWLQEHGLPSVQARPAGRDLSRDAGPVVIKPRKGAGGVGCTMAKSLCPGPEPEVGREYSGQEYSGQEFIVQKFVEGLPASVSVISDGSEAIAIAVNEQIIGASWAGASGFRYSGNITPLDADESLRRKMASIAEEVVSGLGLTGSNGVDFIIAKDGPLVLEVNPRFQGSLDSIELSTEVNVFQAHLNSFCGRLPARTGPRYSRTAGRAVIYADKNIKVERDLRLEIEGLADVPRPGSAIAKDEPVASILASGQEENRARVETMLKERALRLRRALK